VQAAYTMYGAAPANPTPPPSADFPAGYKLVAWIQMRDFILESTAPLFYGFIAQSIVDANQYIVAFRGTANGIEWWDNVNAAAKTPFKVPDCGSVGEGFARIYDSLKLSSLRTARQPLQPRHGRCYSPERFLRRSRHWCDAVRRRLAQADVELRGLALRRLPRRSRSPVIALAPPSPRSM
jgi:hypothetical protein